MSLNTKQNEQLLRGINPKRVLHLRGQSHLAGWDVKAHLTRIFGFEGWDKKIRSVELIFETQGLPDGSKKGWYVTYRCQMTLIIRDPSGNVVREIDGAATGSAENQPQRGEAHDLALKNSVTYALKVCATDLGDQFGLSLYNNGSTNAIVMQTLAGHDDVEQAVPDEVNPDSDQEAQPEPAAAASAAPVNGNGHRPNGNGHAGPDPDREWFEDAMKRAGSFADEEAGQKLWHEIVKRKDKRKLTVAAADELKGTVRARWTELAEQAKADEPVDGEIVPELDPGDPWALRIEEIATVEDAVAISSEVGKAISDGTLDDEKGAAAFAAIAAHERELAERAAA